MVAAAGRPPIWPFSLSRPDRGRIAAACALPDHLATMPTTELIVLVDHRGRPTGTADKESSHHEDTPLHRAFACYVFDDAGRFLATRRSTAKRVWPGVWTNSVCGHPAPGERFTAAIQRRLDQELGMTADGIEVVLGEYVYRAPPFHGIVEHEFCPVFAARARSEPRPNPHEVAEYRWMRWEDFVRGAESDSADGFSWWCKNQLGEIAGPLGAWAAP
jgi:isopentenyl-diphosphate Delta-isomerase